MLSSIHHPSSQQPTVQTIPSSLADSVDDVRILFYAPGEEVWFFFCLFSSATGLPKSGLYISWESSYNIFVKHMKRKNPLLLMEQIELYAEDYLSTIVCQFFVLAGLGMTWVITASLDPEWSRVRLKIKIKSTSPYVSTKSSDKVQHNESFLCLYLSLISWPSSSFNFPHEEIYSAATPLSPSLLKTIANIFPAARLRQASGGQNPSYVSL